MHYTSGTTGRPKGVKRGLFEIDPSDMGELMAYLPNLFGIGPRDGHVHLTVSPLYHTAVLMWTGNALHLGHTVVLMDKWTAEETLRLIDQLPGHLQPHGADPVRAPARPPRGDPGQLRRGARCATWSTAPPPARRRSSAG